MFNARKWSMSKFFPFPPFGIFIPVMWWTDGNTYLGKYLTFEASFHLQHIFHELWILLLVVLTFMLKFYKKNIHKFESIFSNQSMSLWALDSVFLFMFLVTDTVYYKEEWFEYFNYISLKRPFHWKVKYFVTINSLLSYLCTKGQVLAGNVSQASCLSLKVATTKEENNYPPVPSLIIQHRTQWSDKYFTIIPPLDICSHRPL